MILYLQCVYTAQRNIIHSMIDLYLQLFATAHWSKIM